MLDVQSAYIWFSWSGVVTVPLWFMRSRDASINVPARCRLQWHYRKTVRVQRREHMCFNNINFRSSVLEAKLTVPKCNFRSLHGSSQFCIVCATALLVVVAVLCRVGLVEEIASHSSVHTCLNFMWFTFRFPVYSFRINVNRVNGTWPNSCFKLKALTRSVFLCLVLFCKFLAVLWEFKILAVS